MLRPTQFGRVLAISAITTVAAAAPALAGSGPIPTMKYEPQGDGVWVAKIDTKSYGGATGTVTFYDEGYRGPAGSSVNDFQVGTGYDAARPSFDQDVLVKEQDWLTKDPDATVWRDDPLGLVQSPTQALRDGNMDGQVNLGSFGWTTPPGTRFANMKIDRAGNYFVARRDMQWGFFDEYRYRNPAGEVRTLDTGFNFQPYPLSDAYGFCGSVLTLNPRAMQKQSGQLVFDVAFDVYPGDGGAGSPLKMTQVVPGFVMRSYGKSVVDVTNRFGQRQRFTANTSGINHNPVTGDLDERFYQTVSPVGAGVIPAGAWVLHDGDPERMVVVPKGTPGAKWHENEFAGFAYMLRGDAARRVTDVQGTNYERRMTWTDYALADQLKRAPGMRLASVRRVGASVVRVTGRIAKTATGRVRVALGLPTSRGASRRSAVRKATTTRIRAGRFTVRLRLGRASCSRPNGPPFS